MLYLGQASHPAHLCDLESSIALGTQYILSILKFIRNSVPALTWFMISLGEIPEWGQRACPQNMPFAFGWRWEIEVVQ